MDNEILKQILSEMLSMKSEMQSMKSEMQSMKSEMATKEDVESVKQLIRSHHLENIEADDKIMQRIDRLDKTIRIVNRKVSELDIEIELLKDEQGVAEV